MELTIHPSIAELGETDWEGLRDDQSPPFLSYAWLEALESTGCVRPERGWGPAHLALRDGGRLVAAAPAYVKGNSEGEFVFDHGWARFAMARLQIDYYPKLIVAVPFTPAGGPRLLVAPGEDFQRLAATFLGALPGVVERLELSSAHVLFPDRQLAELGSSAGLLHRLGIQFQWHNPGCQNFDDYLSSFSAKRRHAIRRERRALAEQGTTLEVLTGSDLSSELIDHVFECYRGTVERFYWGRQYLCRDFFHEVVARMPEQVHVVLARDGGSKRPIAAAFNLLGPNALYGRYWGALEERPYLHFNVCYYRGIEDAIERGLSRFEPGAGGEHKLARGFVPTITHSLHYLADSRLEAAVADFVHHEAAAVREHVAQHNLTRPAT